MTDRNTASRTDIPQGLGGEAFEREVTRLGQEIFARMEGNTPSIFHKDYWSGRVLEWSMKDEDFKVQLFRFVDVLPCLKTSEQVTRHLEEYFGSGQDFPPVLQWGMKAAGMGSIAGRIASAAIKRNVTTMAERFIVGRDGKEAVKVLRKLRKEPVTFTVDLLGEACVSEEEADTYFRRYHEVLESLARETAKWDRIDVLDTAPWGDLPRVNVSVKITSLYSQLDAIDFEGSVAKVKERLLPLFQKARELGAFIFIDMEHYHIKDLTLAVFKEVLEDESLSDYDQAGIVLQAYLKETEQDARELVEWAHRRGRPITVRLVKGAYWDYETVLAQQHGWPVPVFQDKTATDASFERVTSLLLSNHEVVRTAIGSHNVRSIAHAQAAAKALGLPEGHVEFQMLYGMAEPIRRALVDLGHRVRVYAPIGEMIPGMAYLVRRLLENTSQESFLRQGFAEGVSHAKLLAEPRPQPEPPHRLEVREGASIINMPHTDFAHAEARASYKRAIRAAHRQLGRRYPVVVGGKEIMKDRMIVRENPANPGEIVGEVAAASTVEADQAVAACRKAFGAWRDTAPEKRAEILFEAARIMTGRRFELAAMQVWEVGKPWREADADVAEAIDFLNYYGQEMIRLGRPRHMGGRVPGETNRLFYQPRGTAVIISPWNFPQAILTGMTAAALVAGNCAIIKPANTSSVTAFQVFEILREAGVPEGALHYLPGPGRVIGSHLVSHPDIEMIAFTGSMEVGLGIVRDAAVVHPGQERIKQVICELGGKNAIIVDDDADLDEAVQATVYSAFGFSGQKCSACSRVLVLEENYDEFVHRLIEATRSIVIGNPQDPQTYMGPVIDRPSFERIDATIREADQYATVALRREDVPDRGYFIGPTIITDVHPEHDVAQEEIFGPVLSVIRARSFDEAMESALGVRFALTGGLFSRSPGRIADGQARFRVGNLYINRGTTGALVERQPFGGFKMSGVGSKAGGPDYLLRFTEPRVVTENTMRRGFAPLEEDEP